ncbi:hypothetical protein AciM339_1136 [Aciduliprofundum sp. MAR08-339]|uniref:4Fe-4S dicluster domain-containing protein n=1 Tax=Aciduliprofundum sp. (strain MAR08-339) TaxID=673860 RepID=UPI0002A4CAEC|nr:hypothetical protein AciM339_1136 [Aciduliprofundum sp. MAR08-339]
MGKVLIYGTTLATYRAAANFARAGHKVILLNRGEFLWHKFTQMQWQMPRDIANGYSKALLLNAANMTGNIEVFNNSELLAVEGGPGNFKVRFKHRPASVNEFRCIGCDICHEKCDVKFIPMPLGPGMRIIKNAEECEDVCPAKAIQIPKEEEREEKVEAVILSPEYEPDGIEKYGGNLKNVMNFRDFAWMFRGKGVHKEFLKREDGKYPKSIGFFTPAGFDGYLGSYEEQVILFREALAMKEMDSSLDVHIFAKELRMYGHNQMRLYDEALAKGIKVHIIDDISVVEDGDGVKVNDVHLDLFAVLPGQKIPDEWIELAKRAGIETEHGFAKTKPFTFETTRDGVFALGEFVKPVGSTEAIYQGTAIVPQVEKYLSEGKIPEMPKGEFKQDDFEPKVGVFICECAAKEFNIDVNADFVIKKDFLCLRGEEIVKDIKENGMNRVVFGACSPALRGAMLEMLAAKAGIAPSYVELVQLREYASRVGADSRKANAMLNGAIAKARRDVLVEVPVENTVKSVAIIGGDVAALMAADYLIDKIPLVYIITEEFDEPILATGVKENTLNMRDEELKEWYESLKKRVLSRAKWIKGNVESIEGSLGNFSLKVGEERVDAGVLIIAPGADVVGDGNHIVSRMNGDTLHAPVSAIYAKREGKDATYDLMKSYSLMDLNPPNAKRGEGEPLAYVKPREVNKKIAEMLGLRLDKEGFFFFAEEPRYWIERVSNQFMHFEDSFAGVFIAGLAHRPMSIEEEMEEAGFAAQSAKMLMRDIPSPAGKFVSVTNPRKCAGCGICVDACFTGSRYIDEEDHIAKVRPALCVGCGACANVCPSGAAIIRAYSPTGVFEMLKEVVK